MFQNAFLLEQRQRLALLHWPVAERYARFCRQYPRLRQRVAQKYIASYLGMTPELLSALRTRQGQGLFLNLAQDFGSLRRRAL
ncbi:MAG: hypothetical protein ACRYFZ_28255 [Janthinobacterium lividum]